ncbi:MAG TPA: hypothetical protein VM074_10405 [Solimonas sp.]|nr:hypothetical protein [Solimonas sp.]
MNAKGLTIAAAALGVAVGTYGFLKLTMPHHHEGEIAHVEPPKVEEVFAGTAKPPAEPTETAAAEAPAGDESARATEPATAEPAATEVASAEPAAEPATEPEPAPEAAATEPEPAAVEPEPAPVEEPKPAPKPAAPAPAPKPAPTPLPAAKPAPTPPPAAKPAPAPRPAAEPAPAAPPAKPAAPKPATEPKSPAPATDARHQAPPVKAWWGGDRPDRVSLVYASSAAYKKAIVLMFNGAFDSADSAAKNIKVTDAGGKAVAGKWEVGANNKRMLLMPVPKGGMYQVSVGAGLADNQGRTAKAPMQGPVLVQ